MLKIRFTNGTEIPYVSATETEEYFNGSNRRTLTFEMDPATDIQALSDLCTEANCARLELINTEMEITNVYEDYILKLSVGDKTKYDPESTAVTPYTELKLGKRTFMERALAEESAQQDEIGAQALYTAMMTDTLIEG